MEKTQAIEKFLNDVTDASHRVIDYIEDGQHYVGNGIIVSAITDKESTSKEQSSGVATKMVKSCMTSNGQRCTVDVNRVLKATQYLKAVGNSDLGIDLDLIPDGMRLTNAVNDSVTSDGWSDLTNLDRVTTTLSSKLLIAVMLYEKRLGSKKVAIRLAENNNVIVVDGKATTVIASMRKF